MSAVRLRNGDVVELNERGAVKIIEANSKFPDLVFFQRTPEGWANPRFPAGSLGTLRLAGEDGIAVARFDNGRVYINAEMVRVIE